MFQIGFHDNTRAPEPITIELMKEGVSSNPEPYYRVKIGFELTMFFSPERLLEFGKAIESHLDVDGYLPEYKPKEISVNMLGGGK